MLKIFKITTCAFILCLFAFTTNTNATCAGHGHDAACEHGNGRTPEEQSRHESVLQMPQVQASDPDAEALCEVMAEGPEDPRYNECVRCRHDFYLQSMRNQYARYEGEGVCQKYETQEEKVLRKKQKKVEDILGITKINEMKKNPPKIEPSSKASPQVQQQLRGFSNCLDRGKVGYFMCEEEYITCVEAHENRDLSEGCTPLH